MSNVETLITLMQAAAEAKQVLHDHLKKILKPSPTGYLRRDEDWHIGTWIEDERIYAKLTPPNGDFRWSSSVTRERLTELEAHLHCDHLVVRADEPQYTKHGQRVPICYIASWVLKADRAAR